MRQVLFSALVVWALSLSFTALGEEQAAAMSAGEAAVLVSNDAEAIAFKNIASERTVPEINDHEANALEVNDLEVNASAASSQSTSAAFEGHDLSPWGMYLAADAVVKSVIITLLLASLITWTILCFKLWQLRKRRSQAQHLLFHLSKASSFSAAALSQPMQQAKCLMLLDACKTELDLSADLSAAAADAGLNEGLKERMLTRLNSVQASLAAELNHGTGVLATIGSVAPFVGLFGTVWGIMNSFIGIAETQTTNLAVVAPGIAEALLATAIGLVAAIPAVVIYNYFVRTIGAYRAILADLVAALMILTSRDLDRAAQQKINDEEQDLASTDDKGDEQGDEPVVPALQGVS